MAIKWTEEDVIKAFQEAMQPQKQNTVDRDLILKKLLDQAKQNKKQE